MAMAVVQVGIMRVGVHERQVAVPMRVRLAGGVVGTVGMAVVEVVHMAMRMQGRLMRVRVLVPFGEVQRNPAAINAPAAASRAVSGAANSGTAKPAPRNGAVAK
jgi:hypothetical protein